MRLAPLWLLALAACAAPIPADRWPTLPEALAQAGQSRRPVVVVVTAPWCGPCARMRRTMQTDPGVRERLARLERAELDFDDHTLALRVGEAHVSPFERARLWGIEATPGLVLLDADGRLLGAHTGLLPPDALIAVLDAALALTGS